MTARTEARAGASAERRSPSAPAERSFAEADVKAFERDAKIGLLATVDADHRPHLTLITSLQAKGPRALMFGQFTEGLSKVHVRDDPHTGFLVMSPAREVWRGKARWTHAAKAGEDYELYNHKPMFRYNAYFGIHTIHYLDLVDLADKQKLSAARLAAGTLALALVARFARGGCPGRALTPWAERHLAKVATLKFAAYVAEDGYPVITPPVACRAVDGGRLVFRPVTRGGLGGLAKGQSVAIFAINLKTESVLVRGRFAGWRRLAGVTAGCLDIDWVYNSMPPKQGQIYPPTPLRPVTEFAADSNWTPPARSH